VDVFATDGGRSRLALKSLLMAKGQVPSAWMVPGQIRIKTVARSNWDERH